MSSPPDTKLHFAAEQVAAIEEAFAFFDCDHDGLISLTEFRQILRSLGESATDDEIVAKIREWDDDGDGSINFAEFLMAMTRILTDTDNEQRMKQAFRLFDKDNNGYITPLELSKMMTTLGHDVDAHQIVEMIREADVDNDGKISFAEFKKVMSS